MIEIKNKKANFDYFIEDTYECGIVLTGTEIKSIRKGSANLKESYARVKNNEVFLTNMFISTYEEGNRFNHDERRERKLLLHKKEIYKIRDKVEKEGYSLITPVVITNADNYEDNVLCINEEVKNGREIINLKQLSMQA